VVEKGGWWGVGLGIWVVRWTGYVGGGGRWVLVGRTGKVGR